MSVLKRRYGSRRVDGVRRELFVLNWLNIMLPSEYMAVFTGVGAGDSSYTPGTYTGVLDKWDIAVYHRPTMSVRAFIDVTGYSDPRRARVDSQRCVLSVKLKVATVQGVLDRLWFAHFTDTKHLLLMMKADRLQQLVENGTAERRWLYSDENPVYCLPSRYWVEPYKFLEWLQAQG